VGYEVRGWDKEDGGKGKERRGRDEEEREVRLCSDNSCLKCPELA